MFYQIPEPTMNPEPLHIGQAIHAELIKQDRSVSWLADQLGIQRPNCYRILHSANINTDRLLAVSCILRYDFFADYSKRLALAQRVSSSNPDT